MTNKTLADLGRRCLRLWGFAHGVGRQVAAAGSELLRPLPGGRRLADLYEFQVALGDQLKAQQAELVALQDRLVRAVQRRRELGQARRELAELLRRALSGLQNALSGVLDPGEVRRLLGPADRLPEAAAELALLAERLFAHLTDPALELPPLRPGVEIDPTAIARGFEAPMRQLGATVGELVDAEAAEQHDRAQMTAAGERLRGFAGQVERFLGALYEVTGNPGLAKRLRQGGRRRRSG